MALAACRGAAFRWTEVALLAAPLSTRPAPPATIRRPRSPSSTPRRALSSSARRCPWARPSSPAAPGPGPAAPCVARPDPPPPLARSGPWPPVPTARRLPARAGFPRSAPCSPTLPGPSQARPLPPAPTVARARRQPCLCRRTARSGGPRGGPPPRARCPFGVQAPTSQRPRPLPLAKGTAATAAALQRAAAAAAGAAAVGGAERVTAGTAGEARGRGQPPPLPRLRVHGLLRRHRRALLACRTRWATRRQAAEPGATTKTRPLPGLPCTSARPRRAG